MSLRHQNLLRTIQAKNFDFPIILSKNISCQIVYLRHLAHQQLAQLSLVYLLSIKEEIPDPISAVFYSLPYFQYASQSWYKHTQKVQLGKNSTILHLLSLLFLEENISCLHNARRADTPDGLSYSEFGRTNFTSLHLASFLGFTELCEQLVGAGHDIHAKAGFESGSVLHSASYQGHEAIVRFLLQSGADVNDEGGRFGYALQAASDGGHEAIVKLLLQSGADVNAQGGECGHALEAAASEGHQSVVKLLLQSGAEIADSQDGFRNALLHASDGGHEAVVKLLLQSGADVNARGDRHYVSALQAAAEGGHQSVVRLLLQSGADINVQGGYYGNAIQAASAYGDPQL
jgi:ankyrin repeat protein